MTDIVYKLQYAIALAEYPSSARVPVDDLREAVAEIQRLRAIAFDHRAYEETYVRRSGGKEVLFK